MNDDLPQGHRSDLPGILGTVDSGISRIESLILALGVLLMAVNTVGNVLSRFLFGESLHFAEEVNRILIIMITFAGIGYAARHGRHIRMSALYDAFPVKVRRYLMIMIAFATSAIMFFLAYYSVTFIVEMYGRGRVLPTLGTPIWMIYVWAPIGFTVTAIQYLLTGIKNCFSKDVYLSTQVLDGYEDTETEV